MAGLTRRLLIAALALLAAPAFAGAQADPATDWTEWTGADELGWVQGAADAPLTVIEYFSPTCSHCKQFADEVMPGIRNDYIDTGKVRFVMREWIRNNVDTAIITQARCLNKQDGLAFLEDVFARQDEVFVAAQIGTLPGTLTIIGTPYGITDREKFDTCYKDMNTRFDIQEVDRSGAHYDVDSTPTFVVDGTPYKATVALTSPEGFAAFLDAELAKLPPATN